MMLLRQILFGSAAVMLMAQPLRARVAEDTNATPDYLEVKKLISEHLAGESATDLNRDSVLGLLHELHGRVSLTGGSMPMPDATNATVLSKTVLYDDGVAYLRVGHVGEGLSAQISKALKDLPGTNQLKGVVLDLRFAGGTDYSAAVSAADLFIAKERPLLDWGNGVVQSKTKTDAVTVPLAILVNQETAAAAEALAAILRGDDRAILLGATTAGEAAMSQEYPLKNGQFLRIATSAIKLGGGEAISTKGVKPDIQVNVKPEDERSYYADPYKEIASSSGLIASLIGDSVTTPMSVTNRPVRQHQINEAELMRERRERPGMELDEVAPPMTEKEIENEPRIMRDPVLGRALDLIKGLSLINRAQAP
ncbi:MAG TPA: S41 family peptidase [Verrucomicrobiae bacterium]|jgi:hypothetical protein|nr:S41 family peptidase [Verrucomicrobiae bacterium]